MTSKTKRNRISSSNLFLMELIVALLIFSVSSAACVTVFMKSHQMSEHAAALSRATDEAGSAAELIRGCSSVPELFEAMAAQYPEAVLDSADTEEKKYISFFIFLDEDGKSCTEEKAMALVAVEASYSDSLLEATLICRKTDGKGDMSGEILAEIPVKHYIPENTSLPASKGGVS